MKIKGLLLTTTCALFLVGCGGNGQVPSTRNGGNSQETVFEKVVKACDGNDMIYVYAKNYRGGLAVVANHPDCVGLSTKEETE